MKINLLLASRGRPLKAFMAYQSALTHAERKDRLQLCLRLDEDDPKLGEYELPVNTIIGPRIGAPASFDELARTYPADIQFVMADDVRFRTPCWDEMMEEIVKAAGAKPVAFFTNDGAGRLTHPGVNQKWVEVCGNLWSPKLKHFWADTWIEKTARAAGCFVMAPEILVEHVHPKYNKGEWDVTYDQERSEEKTKADILYFHGEGERERDEWITRLRSACA